MNIESLKAEMQTLIDAVDERLIDYTHRFEVKEFLTSILNSGEPKRMHETLKAMQVTAPILQIVLNAYRNPADANFNGRMQDMLYNCLYTLLSNPERIEE